jgi:transglutaminase-like putative cysteine protease
MKKLMIMLLFASLSFSETIDTSMIRSMNISFTMKATAEVNHGNIIALFVNMSVPQKTEYQIINYPGRHAVDQNGNLFAIVEVANPSNPYTLPITTNVMTTGRVTKELPAYYSVPADALRYTMVTDRIQSNSPEIQNTALNITANSTDNFERIAKISMYVQNLVQYDISYVGTWKDALWIFRNKKGVCLEYATLYAAMVRSIGIPARIIIGYAYDNSQNAMIGHAWNEVYIGKWIPVDPLWGEIGYLDGGHVETARILDNETPDHSYLTRSDWGAAEVKFKTSTSDPTYKAKPTFYSLSFLEKVKGYALEPQSANITAGSSTNVELAFNGTDYRVVSANLIPMCENILVEGDFNKKLIVEPNSTVKAVWVIKANNINKDNDTCQLSFTSDYLEGKNFSVTVNRISNTQANVTGNQGNGTQTNQKITYCVPLFVLLPLLAAAFYKTRN